uniref:Uncharacterized protein MANES_02G065500 n=1 Tax=Rhizophora mucronata TaxID=61149 RepID=A0A2P2LDT0_RHIMU
MLQMFQKFYLLNLCYVVEVDHLKMWVMLRMMQMVWLIEMNQLMTLPPPQGQDRCSAGRTCA